MKIIFITREGYQLAGARVRCYNFARELNKAGFDTHVFSFADQLGAKCGEKEFEMSTWDKLRLSIRAYKILIKESRDTVFILQRVNYHVLAPLLVAFMKGNRFILDCDDWNIRENPVYYFGFYPSSKMEYLTRKIAARAMACIVASRYLQGYLKRFNPRTYYLPTGVDADRFLPCVDANRLKITFSWVGTAYHKEMGDNIRFLLSCFDVVAKDHDNVFLSLAGEGKFFEEVKKEIGRYKHKARISFHAWVSADNMPEYLSAVDIGLLPLIQDTKFNKAKSPTKLFEYMSMGKPTVASHMGEAAYILHQGHAGLLAKDAYDFVACMCQLVENPQLRQDMGKNARELVVSKFSLNIMGRRLADMIKSVVSR